MRTDFETMIEMLNRAGIQYLVCDNNTTICCGPHDSIEFYFNENGELIGGC